MPVYKATLTHLPELTPLHHTIEATIYLPITDPLTTTPVIIGALTFQKDPAETWAQAAARFRQLVTDYIATYEQAISLDAQIRTWLQTQQWTT